MLLKGEIKWKKVKSKCVSVETHVLMSLLYSVNRGLANGIFPTGVGGNFKRVWPQCIQFFHLAQKINSPCDWYSTAGRNTFMLLWHFPVNTNLRILSGNCTHLDGGISNGAWNANPWSAIIFKPCGNTGILIWLQDPKTWHNKILLKNNLNRTMCVG